MRYPAAALHCRFLERFPSAEQLGATSPGPGAVPWLVAEGLTLEQGQLQQENWCGVFQVRRRGEAGVAA